MWCIINKINNENDALLFNTQQNDLITTSYFNLINNSILSKKNRIKYSPLFHVRSSDYSPKKIKLKQSIIASKINSNYNYAQNMGMK